MSVPFKFKQFYRDLYEYLANGRPTLQANDFGLFTRMLDPPFPYSVVKPYADKAPMSQDTFLSFIAEGQKATAEPYDTLLWKYVASAVKYNLFGGEQQMPLKDFRAMIDASLKMYKKEAELTVLYNNACPLGSAAPDIAPITNAEVASFLNALSKTVALPDVFKVLLPKKRQGKMTNIAPPPLSDAGGADEGSAAGGDAPSPPPPPPEDPPALPYTDPSSSSKPASPLGSTTVPTTAANNKPSTPTSATMKEVASPTFSAKEPSSATLPKPSVVASAAKALEPTPTVSTPPPPAEQPPAAAASVSVASPLAQSVMSGLASSANTINVNNAGNNVGGGMFGSSAAMAADNNNPSSPYGAMPTTNDYGMAGSGTTNPVAKSPTRRPSDAGVVVPSNPITYGNAGLGGSYSSPVDAFNTTTNANNGPTSAFQHYQQQQPISYGLSANQQQPSYGNPYHLQHSEQQLQQPQAPPPNPINPTLQRLANEQQAAVSLFPHHDAAAAGGGILPLPALPNEVLGYVTELDRQRQLLAERLEQEMAQLQDANAAVAVLKNRVKVLSAANAAYFAAGALQPSIDGNTTAEHIFGGATDALSDEDRALLEATKADASGMDPAEAASLSPFYQLQLNRTRLQHRMEEWLAHAKAHNAFLRQEVVLAREQCRYDTSSAALAAYREQERSHLWASGGGGAANGRSANTAEGHSGGLMVADKSLGGFAVAPAADAHNTNANAMSPYRVARFYSAMAKKDKELEEKQRLLGAMSAIEQREQILADEIAAMERRHKQMALQQQQQSMSIPMLTRPPAALNTVGTDSNEGTNKATESMVRDESAGAANASTHPTAGIPDHLFYNSGAPSSAAHRYQQQQAASVPSIQQAYGMVQRADPQFAAREQQRRMAVEALRQQQMAAGLHQQPQQYGSMPSASVGPHNHGRGAIVSNVEQYLKQGSVGGVPRRY